MVAPLQQQIPVASIFVWVSGSRGKRSPRLGAVPRHFSPRVWGVQGHVRGTERCRPGPVPLRVDVCLAGPGCTAGLLEQSLVVAVFRDNFWLLAPPVSPPPPTRIPVSFSTFSPCSLHSLALVRRFGEVGWKGRWKSPSIWVSASAVTASLWSGWPDSRDP